MVIVDQVGGRAVDAVKYTASVFFMAYSSIRLGLLDQKRKGAFETMRVLFSQVYYTGVEAMPIVAIMATMTGALFIIQAHDQLSKVGGGNMIGDLMIMVIFREASPLISALVVIARSGTAVASELGNMMVNREVEALESLGINPLSYIVFPRLLGGVVSLLCLSFYFSAFAILGGYFVGQFFHQMPFAFYMDNIAKALSFDDVLIFLFKNTFSGLIIFVVCCYQGLQVKNSPHEVPQVTTKAVVNSIIYVMGFNAMVTLLVYLKNLKALGIL